VKQTESSVSSTESSTVRDRAAGLLLGILLVLARPLSGQAGKGVEVWGEGWYQAAAADAAASPWSSFGVAQEGGFSLNARSPRGLEALVDIVVPLDVDREITPEALAAQLYVRASPAPGVSVAAGRQRLNWGTARIFSPIDTLEIRANPLDLRPFLPGLAGLKVDVFPNESFGLSLVALPASDIRWSRAAVRVELLLEGVGLDLGFGLVKYGDPGLSDRVALLGDGAWSIGPLVLYEEIQLRWGRSSGYLFPGMLAVEDLGGAGEPVVRAAAGVTLPVDLGLTRPQTLLVEYFFNGDGLTPDEARTFASRYVAWQGAGAPAGAALPGAFASLGGLRRHYAAAAFRDIALDRFLLLGVTAIYGIDSMLGWLAVELEWEVAQGTSFGLRCETGHAFRPDEPTDLLLIPFRNRITLSVTTGY